MKKLISTLSLSFVLAILSYSAWAASNNLAYTLPTVKLLSSSDSVTKKTTTAKKANATIVQQAAAFKKRKKSSNSEIHLLNKYMEAIIDATISMQAKFPSTKKSQALNVLAPYAQMLATFKPIPANATITAKNIAILKQRISSAAYFYTQIRFYIRGLLSITRLQARYNKYASGLKQSFGKISMSSNIPPSIFSPQAMGVSDHVKHEQQLLRSTNDAKIYTPDMVMQKETQSKNPPASTEEGGLTW